ncbi:protein-tyrosine phosphatase-like protein, partial [Entophlyctis helioformis]
LITDCPDPASLAAFADLLVSHGVSHLVRICSPTAYDAAVLASAGIAVHDMYFDDGEPYFRSLVQQLTASTAAAAAPSAAAAAAAGTGKPSLAIHCVSGIGRAPVLVCCALIDAGLDPTDAVEFVRSKRRGAVNRVQLSWL